MNDEITINLTLDGHSIGCVKTANDLKIGLTTIKEEINLRIVRSDILNLIHEIVNDSKTKENPAMVAAITELYKEVSKN